LYDIKELTRNRWVGEVRGYGGSKGLVGKYNSDEIAHDTFALAKHLGWENFHLVAHSMNGMAGFKTLLIDSQMEHKIKNYVAVTPVTRDGYPASEEEAAFLGSAVSDRQVSDNAFSALTGGKLNSAWANYKTSRNKLTSRADAMNEYLNMWLNEDFSQEFANAKIKTPVMVIGGRNDLPGFQEEHFQKTLVKWLPNVSFNYIENAGHYPMYETPILFATLIEKHLDANR